MPFIGEHELTRKILEVNQSLQAQAIELDILKNTYRDYQVQFELKVNGEKRGKGIVYFSEKKQSFRVRILKATDVKAALAVEEVFAGVKTKTGLIAYVDGSFIGGTSAFGAVILENDKVLEELNGVLDKSEAVFHQIGGELRASLEVMKWAKDHGYKGLTICYDYEGVRRFATGEWKVENSLAALYHSEFKKFDLKVNWNKIAAHTGVKWNERADQLAKEAAKSNPSSLKLPRAEKLAKDFCILLEGKGLSVDNKGLINGQFVRLVVTGNKPVYFDLYDTKNRPLIPYIHGGDSELAKRLQVMFLDFKKQLPELRS